MTNQRRTPNSESLAAALQCLHECTHRTPARIHAKKGRPRKIGRLSERRSERKREVVQTTKKDFAKRVCYFE